MRMEDRPFRAAIGNAGSWGFSRCNVRIGARLQLCRKRINEEESAALGRLLERSF